MKTCSVEGCIGRYYAKGYCEKHYDQVRAHGKLLERTSYSPNEFRFEDDICYIQMYDEKCSPSEVALIDQEDYDKIKEYKWGLRGGKSLIIANRKVGFLSRFLLDVTDSNLDVDHKNHDRLDNRKENLRVCTRLQNNYNRQIRSDNVSGYKGVSWNSQVQKWMVQIQYEGKKVHLGKFNNKEEAAQAWNEAAIKYHKEFAFLNEIPKKE